MMAMTRDIIPQNLASLHSAEEHLRQKARSMIADDPRLQLHLAVTEAAMDLADTLRQFNSSDEDLKVAQILGMRTFNAFAASTKLTVGQGCAPIAHGSEGRAYSSPSNPGQAASPIYSDLICDRHKPGFLLHLRSLRLR